MKNLDTIKAEAREKFEAVFKQLDKIDTSSEGYTMRMVMVEVLDTLLTSSYQAGVEAERERILAVIPPRQKFVQGEYKDRRANGFNECRNLIIEALTNPSDV